MKTPPPPVDSTSTLYLFRNVNFDPGRFLKRIHGPCNEATSFLQEGQQQHAAQAAHGFHLAILRFRDLFGMVSENVTKFRGLLVTSNVWG